MLLTRAQLITWLHKLQVEKEPMCVPLASQQQQLLKHSFNVLVNSYEMANELQSASLQLSYQYQRTV
jgi:hypothetical protein